MSLGTVSFLQQKHKSIFEEWLHINIAVVHGGLLPGGKATSVGRGRGSRRIGIAMRASCCDGRGCCNGKELLRWGGAAVMGIGGAVTGVGAITTGWGCQFS